MTKKNTPPPPQTVSWLEEDFFLDGEVRFSSDICFSGKAKGQWLGSEQATADFLETSEFEGNVECGTVIVRGKWKGHIKASKKCVLKSGAHIQGDIVAPSIEVEPGVKTEGLNLSIRKN